MARRAASGQARREPGPSEPRGTVGTPRSRSKARSRPAAVHRLRTVAATSPRTLARMQIAELQDVLRRTYLDRDSARGADGVFRWMVEEVGEVARAMRTPDDREHLELEFS